MSANIDVKSSPSAQRAPESGNFEIPRTMKGVMYYNNHDVRLLELPVPEIGPGEILVRTEACGLCGSELTEYYMIPRAPLVMGHEPAG
ncbi:MAG TPA: alcohol dehydrogenase catalytic domain-containing protein, partial [Anaerolineaceae bacterium]